MIREEATKLVHKIRMDIFKHLDTKELTALDMAIEALRNCSEKPNGSLINRQDAIRIVDQISREEMFHYMESLELDVRATQICHSAIEAVGTIKEQIEALPSADRPTGWIPVSERLPGAEYGESDSVLCCTESGLMYILYWNGGNWCVPTGEPHHWVNHKTGWHDKVIAWMPLPPVYQGE